MILDWTPAHFPRDAHGLAFFDGTHLYEHEDPRRGAHPDWGTLVFNYGRNEVQNFLLSNALFWIDKYHIDGLRVDAVASMLYLDYSRAARRMDSQRFRRARESGCHRVFEAAERSAARAASRRADDRRGIHVLAGGFAPHLHRRARIRFEMEHGLDERHAAYFALDPIHRQYHHGKLTFSMLYAFHENFILPLSHDEVVHGKRALLEKMPGDDWQKFANLRLLFGYMFAHPGKKPHLHGQRTRRSGTNSGKRARWIGRSKNRHRIGASSGCSADLNRLHAREHALHEVDFEWSGFEWLEANDAAASVLSFLRRAKKPEDFMVVVCNFTPVVREELSRRCSAPRLLSRNPEHRFALITKARTSAIPAACAPSRSRGTTGLTRSSCGCPRSLSSTSSYNETDRGGTVGVPRQVAPPAIEQSH